ncbi:MAG: hypothetical protein K6C13_09660 [Oscillospiraceae bacterium]|nr:hypothetical protein [Oscillospiraceae bacterium]
MDIDAFFKQAKQLADKAADQDPAVKDDPDAAFCLILNTEDQIFSGVTEKKADNNDNDSVPAEINAASGLMMTSNSKAKQMIVIRFSDSGIVAPCKEALELLLRADSTNGECEVVMSMDNSVNANEILNGTSAGNTENTAEKSSLGAPAEFVDGFDVDTSNPFYEAPQAAPAPEVQSFADNGGNNANNMNNGQGPQYMFNQPADAQQQGAAGFNPYAYQQNQGYNQRYPQQQGYPQQGFRPQQGFPQQGYPQQGFQQQGMQQGFAQQGMQQQFPQQGMQQQFPQQGAQQFPQQGMQQGFPQQGAQQFPQQGMRQQNMNDPMAANPMNINPNVPSHYFNAAPAHSVYSNMNSSVYQGSSIMSSKKSGSTFKDRLNKFMDTDEDEPDVSANAQEPEMTKEEMLKAAKEKKKQARQGLFNKN